MREEGHSAVQAPQRSWHAKAARCVQSLPSHGKRELLANAVRAGVSRFASALVGRASRVFEIDGGGPTAEQLQRFLGA